jgi:zinc/manganese transport system substrate-binding protein
MKAKLLVIILVAVGLLAALSCRAPADNGGRQSIVVTYSILGSVVKDLVGDAADVSVSVPNGLDPHEFEPSARDIEAINKADLVVENGLGLEEGMKNTLAAARRSGVRFFTVADHVQVRHVGPGEGIPTGDPDQALGAPDPHFWTDPLEMTTVVAALAPVLQTELGLDVSAQAAILENRLGDLDIQVAVMLVGIPELDRKLVTGHESMGYFARRYGFKLVGVIVPSLSSQAEVSAADLAALKQAISDNQVKAVFTELGTSPAVARAIADETGVTVIQLTTHALPADGSYASFMKELASTIADALK